MKFRQWFNIHTWIENLKYKWSLLAPPHRVLFLTIITGMLFTLALSIFLDSKKQTQNISNPHPSGYGLIADRDMHQNTRLELLYFSFEQIPIQTFRSCSRPVTLADSNTLNDLYLKKPVAKDQFLCWSDLETNINELNPKIRRGYRVIGFQVSNPEIAPYIKISHLVDVNLFGETAESLKLKHLKIVDIFMQNGSLTVLLELSKSQLAKIEQNNGPYTTAQILLKNQDEPKQATKPRKRKGPKIHKG